MRTEIHWTAKSEGHIARHGVTPAEAEEAVFSRPQYVGKSREETTIVLGQTFAGRYLAVLLTESSEVIDAWYCITAREMTDSERRLYKRKAK